MVNRSRIPIEIAREVLIGSGHRCAVCGEGCPLERAHIIPWRESKEHKVEDLICLCANCHARADKEKWGEKTLREYKKKPWIVRRFEDTVPITNPVQEVELTIGELEITQYGESHKRLLQYALAAFLNISPEVVRITEVKKGSVKVTVELPAKDANSLIKAYKREDLELERYLNPMNVVKLRQVNSYVGTIVGESTSRELRLALAHESVREQDIIAVDAELKKPDSDDETEKIRIWAKVQRIERINPLFPSEAGHELAATQTDPFDTVLSLSREMVTAVCQVLGAEPLNGSVSGKLNQLRYPAKPATRAYRPKSEDIARIVVGDLREQQTRALDLATLSNRPGVNVMVDGHDIVTRHLAILAMTGAGKSVTARRIIEELAKKNYPIVIFDPHGDYTGLADVPGLREKVKRYHAQFPVFEQSSETVVTVVETLGWELAKTHRSMFDSLFYGAKTFLATQEKQEERAKWLSDLLSNPNIAKYGIKPDLYFLADFVQAVVEANKGDNEGAVKQLIEWSNQDQLKTNKQTAGWLEGLPNNLRVAAKRLKQMENISKRVAGNSEPLPTDRTELVRYGGISIVALAGYTGDFQATLYSLIAEKIFSARVANELKLPVLLLLEEAHNFAPARASTTAEQNAITITKQIAQEGRKFGVGLILISQRPSRLDETTLSQCNSYVIMRMVNPADQSFIRRVIESLGEDEARMLPDLDVGEAVLSGQFINFPVLVKIKEPESQGEHEERDAFKVLEEAYEGVGA